MKKILKFIKKYFFISNVWLIFTVSKIITRMQKKKLIVSVSGGETSMFMAKWLFDNKQKEFDMVFLFANVGEEHEETLEFIKNFEDFFKIPIIWLEADILIKFEYLGKIYIDSMSNNILNRLKYIQRKRYGINKKQFNKKVKYLPIGTSYKTVDFKTATRSIALFDRAVRKYGLFSIKNPTCTRELKERPIHSYAKKKLNWAGYYTAIGIRADEFDRISVNREKMRLYYPLVKDKPMTKKHINSFWRFQPFRLNLTGYQGNCKACYKKSFTKLYTIAKENIKAFDGPLYLENKYGNYVPPTKGEAAKNWLFPITMFRGKKSAKDIIKEASSFDKTVINENDLYEESCEVFTKCESQEDVMDIKFLFDD